MFRLAELEEGERGGSCPREREAGRVQSLVAKEMELVKGDKRDSCLQAREAGSELKLELKQQVKVSDEQRDAFLQKQEAGRGRSRLGGARSGRRCVNACA